MAIHSSILAWKIPWTEEPGGPTVHGVARVEHDLVTKPPAQGVSNWGRGKGHSNEEEIQEKYLAGGLL